MSEGLKIVLTAASGVGIFVIGQIMQKWFIEPIQEQRKLVGDIVYSLVYHANLFSYSTYFSLAAKTRQHVKKLEGGKDELLDEAYEAFRGKTSEVAEKLRRLSSQIH